MTVERRRELMTYVAGWIEGIRQDKAVPNKEKHMVILTDIIAVLAGLPSDKGSCVGEEHMSDYPPGFGLKQPPWER